jgi:DNA-binding beta-propeller fold protein YncE
VITRRQFALGGAALSASCRKQRGDGYAGYAFVANQEGRAVAAVDLTAFAVARHIRLEDAPSAILTHPSRSAVYVLTPQSGVVYEIDPGKLAVTRKVGIGSGAVGMRMAPGEPHLWVLGASGRKLVRLGLESFAAEQTVVLPEAAVSFDISAYTNLAGLSYGSAGAVGLVNLSSRSAGAPVKLGGEAGAVCFQGNGQGLLAANLGARQLTVLAAPEGRIIVNLPLAVKPEHFCFNQDGGQLFITGDGRDAVVVVYPYYVPEVAETVLAGSKPGAMAASQNFLFVANPEAGDVTILNIGRRRVVAVAGVGAGPGHITVTPDDEYALVLNQVSGDMAVIRIPGLQPDRRKTAALFTIIPVGSKPIGAVVKAV